MFASSVYKQFCSDENLNKAWRAIRRQGQATGVDGVSLTYFDSRSFLLLKALQADLLKFKYKPQPVKRIFIKRKVGAMRPLGIATVRDRIVQRAMVQMLSPRFEPHFDDYSHAYRTGRSPQSALAQARDHALGSRPWLVKLDLEDCFGTIPHRPLQRIVQKRMHDSAIRRLLKKFLEVEVITESNSGLRQMEKQKGLLQGSPLSPLLANIYLDLFDKAARERELRFVRYADDIAIFETTRQSAEQAMDMSLQILEKLGLQPNRNKTRLLNLVKGCTYLGEWLALEKSNNGHWKIANKR
ncbi:MAG: hypothetical protein DWQ05_16865 [Calditrichaeota bacterium]|nr:MAG: hypothetical protein DWQ05_16865 [Calditrichota bacterium]